MFNVNTIILTRDEKNIRKREKKYRDEIDIEIKNRDRKINEKINEKMNEKFINAFRVKKIMYINNALNALLNKIQNYK